MSQRSREDRSAHRCLWTAVRARAGSRAPCDTMLDLLAAARQPFTSADARALGVEPNQLARLVRSGGIRRVAHGAFVVADLWAEATPEQRHLLMSRAVARRFRSVALSHGSAAVAHRLPLYRVDLGLVHVTRTGHAARCGRVGRHPPIQIHPPLPPEAYTSVDGIAVCTEAAAVLQIADWHGVEPGMVAAEAALHRGSIAASELGRAREVVRLGRGRRRADTVLRLAGAASESPGETLTRLLLIALDVGEIRQQVSIALPGGGTARVDFLLPDLGVVVEFDGRVKYEGADGRDALVREKRREDGIRATGRGVVRLTWPDLSRPRHVRRLLQRGAAVAAAS